jgi:hypothetical protein
MLTHPPEPWSTEESEVTVDTKSVVDAPARNIPEMIAARAKRGRDLVLSSRQLIVRNGPETYLIPSATTKESYRVRYGGEVEKCTCPDAQVHPTVSCKHLVAVSLLYVARRNVTLCGYYEGYHFLGEEGPEGEEIIHRVACKRCSGRSRIRGAS